MAKEESTIDITGFPVQVEVPTGLFLNKLLKQRSPMIISDNAIMYTSNNSASIRLTTKLAKFYAQQINGLAFPERKKLDDEKIEYQKFSFEHFVNALSLVNTFYPDTYRNFIGDADDIVSFEALKPYFTEVTPFSSDEGPFCAYPGLKGQVDMNHWSIKDTSGYDAFIQNLELAIALETKNNYTQAKIIGQKITATIAMHNIYELADYKLFIEAIAKSVNEAQPKALHAHYNVAKDPTLFTVTYGQGAANKFLTPAKDAIDLVNFTSLKFVLAANKYAMIAKKADDFKLKQFENFLDDKTFWGGYLSWLKVSNKP